MGKGLLGPLKRPSLEFGKAMDMLQSEIVTAGVKLLMPRPMVLRLRGEEPESFSRPKLKDKNLDARVKRNLATCKEWPFLDRLL